MLSSSARRSNSNKLASLAGLRTITQRSLKNERKNILQTGTEDPVSAGETGADDSGQTEEEKGA
jgi:hypothetical protein